MSPPDESGLRALLRGTAVALRDGLVRMRGQSGFAEPPALFEPPEPAPPPSEPAELGARLEHRVFDGVAGRREYLLHIPAIRPVGLVLMLHGCRQTPEDFVLGTRMNGQAAARGLAVAWPRQTASANPARCWNWYDHANQMHHSGEAAILAGIVRDVLGEFGLGPDRVFVAGLSAGGAMASVLTHTHPDLFAAAGIHSGVACGSAEDLRTGLAAMKGRFAVPPDPPPESGPAAVPTIVFQGEADDAVHPANGDRLLVTLRPRGRGGERRETREVGGRVCRIATGFDEAGRVVYEIWHIDGAGHAWFGGDPRGSWTEREGPDATAEMLRFFLDAAAARKKRRDLTRSTP